MDGSYGAGADTKGKVTVGKQGSERVEIRDDGTLHGNDLKDDEHQGFEGTLRRHDDAWEELQHVSCHIVLELLRVGLMPSPLWPHLRLLLVAYNQTHNISFRLSEIL